MSLSYDKIKKRTEEGGFWTSYSDLATVLSILYLVLYVVATLRSTSAVVVERTGLREAQKEIESLKEQLRSYEVLKEDYVAGQSKAEKRMYGDLLSQMELLEDDASKEKDRLLDQAKQTAKKEQDLNRYQKIIKNIISTNQLAQKEIKHRDKVIREKSEDIEQLQSSIQDKEAKIRKNRQSIAQIQKSLQDSVHRLETAKASNARTRAEMKAKVARLQKDSARQVEALQRENQSSEAQLAETRTVIARRTEELEQTQDQLQAVESQKTRELAELERERESYQLSLSQVKAQHENTLTEERLRFQDSLQKEKLTSQEQLKREQAYQQKIEAEKARYAQQLVDIEGTLEKAKRLAKQKEEALGEAMAMRQKRHQEELEEQREGFTAQLESREKEFKGQLEGMRARNEALRRDKEKAAERYAEEAAGYQSAMADLTNEHGKSLSAAQARFEAGLAKEKLSGEARLARERGHLAQMEAEKAEYNAKLKGLSERLTGTQAAAARQEAEYRGKLVAQRGQFEKAMGDLKGMYEGNLAKERAAFEAGLTKERLSAAERDQRQKAYAQKLAQEKEEYNAKMRGLAEQLDGTRKAIASQQGEYKRNIAKLSDSNEGMQREIAALRQREADRTALAKKIKENFARSGIKADVNTKTGEVQIQFGEEYFDTGKSGLKDGMRQVLESAMPAYAKSILEDDKLAERIASVEIVGFASPTYKGSYVNPKDLRPEARKAVDYNMDLSYQRAKSIFDFAFNPKRFKYKYQNELLPMAKVTGQGYLKAEGTKDGKEMSGEEYCSKYDCTKAQKVVIKFHFKE